MGNFRGAVARVVEDTRKLLLRVRGKLNCESFEACEKCAQIV